MNNNILLKRCNSLNELKRVIDENKILILDDSYPDTYMLVSRGDINTFGFVTDSYGCGTIYKNDSVSNLNYIGVGKFLMVVDNNGNLVFQIKLKSILDDFIIIPGKGIIAICELDVYSIANNEIKWCIGFNGVVNAFNLGDDGKNIKLELDTGENLLVDIDNGEVSVAPKRL